MSISTDLTISINKYNQCIDHPLIEDLRKAVKVLKSGFFNTIVEILPEVKNLKNRTIYILSNFFYKHSFYHSIFATVFLDINADKIAEEKNGLKLWEKARNNYIFCEDANDISLNKYCAKMISLSSKEPISSIPYLYLLFLKNSKLNNEHRIALTERIITLLDTMDSNLPLHRIMLRELLFRGDIEALKPYILQGFINRLKTNAWGSAIKLLIRGIGILSPLDEVMMLNALIVSINIPKCELKRNIPLYVKQLFVELACSLLVANKHLDSVYSILNLLSAEKTLLLKFWECSFNLASKKEDFLKQVYDIWHLALNTRGISEEGFLTLWNQTLRKINLEAIDKELDHLPKHTEGYLWGMSFKSISIFYSMFLIRSMESFDEIVFEDHLERTGKLLSLCISVNYWLKALKFFPAFTNNETKKYFSFIIIYMIKKTIDPITTTNINDGFNSFCFEITRMLNISKDHRTSDGYSQIKQISFQFLSKDIVSVLLNSFADSLSLPDLEFCQFVREEEWIYIGLWEYTNHHSSLSLKNKLNIAALLCCYGFKGHLEDVKKIISKETSPEDLYFVLRIFAKGLLEKAILVEEFLQLPITIEILSAKQITEIRSWYLIINLELQETPEQIRGAITRVLPYIPSLFEHCKMQDLSIPRTVKHAIEKIAILPVLGDKKLPWDTGRTNLFEALPDEYFSPGKNNASNYLAYFLALRALITYPQNELHPNYLTLRQRAIMNSVRILNRMLDLDQGEKKQQTEMSNLFMETCVRNQPKVVKSKVFADFWKKTAQRQLFEESSDAVSLYLLFMEASPSNQAPSSDELMHAINKGISLKTKHSFERALKMYEKMLSHISEQKYSKNIIESFRNILKGINQMIYEQPQIAKIIIQKITPVIEKLLTGNLIAQEILIVYRESILENCDHDRAQFAYELATQVISIQTDEFRKTIVPCLLPLIRALKCCDSYPGIKCEKILTIRKILEIDNTEDSIVRQTEQWKLLIKGAQELRDKYILIDKKALKVKQSAIHFICDVATMADVLLQYGFERKLHRNASEVMNFLLPILDFHAIKSSKNPISYKGYLGNIFKKIGENWALTESDQILKKELFTKWIDLIMMEFSEIV